MITFDQFINETLIIEMPHIMLAGNKVVELEVHSKMKPNEFVEYIEDWDNGKPIPSKMPRIFDASKRSVC